MTFAHISDSPYFEPMLLFGIGLVTLLVWLATKSKLPRFRLLKLGTSALALTLALYLMVDRSTRFWDVEYDASSRELVLDRLTLQPDLRVGLDDIETMSMFRIAERTLLGSREATKFVIGTKSGELYDSGPMYRDTWEPMAHALRVAASARGESSPPLFLSQ